MSYLNGFSKFLTAGKRMKFATKPIWHRPSHLRHVATIPWEIKNSNFCRYSANMEENASIMHSPLTLLFVHKFWYFRCLKMGCLSPYPLQINFFVSLFFWLFTFAINLWHRKFVTADVTATFVNDQHGIQRQNKILIRSLYLKGYTANRLTYGFPEKRWTKHGVNKLLKTLRDTGRVYRRP